MSPMPAAPIASRIATIQGRIGGIRGAMGFSGGGRLGPPAASQPSFADTLQAVSGQAGTAGTTATIPAGGLPGGGLPGSGSSITPGVGLPTSSVGAGATHYARPGVATTTTAQPVGRPTVDAALVEAALAAAASPTHYARPTAVANTAFAGTSAAVPAARQELQPGADFGSAIVSLAAEQIGTPYVWGGESHAEGGFDCSGLILHTYRRAGIELPRVSRDQAQVGEGVGSLADALPGDLIAFGQPVDHIGIYAGNNQMVVAPHTGAQVRVQTITDTPTAIRRIVPAGTVVAGAPGTAPEPPGVGPLTSGQVDLAAAGVPFAAELTAAALRHGLPPEVLAAVAKTESAFNASAVSPAGALGLMQIMPGTAAELGVDPMDPAQAADGAARYLRQQLDSFGSLELALAAYNAGPGNVRRYDGIPPFTETQNYVPKVMTAIEELR